MEQVEFNDNQCFTFTKTDISTLKKLDGLKSGANLDSLSQNPHFLYEIGKKLFQKKDYTVAIDWIERLLNYQFYFDADGCSLLANCYVKKGQFSKAIEIFKYALKENEGCDRVYNDLGLIYFCNKNYQVAINCFKRSLACNLKYLPALYNISLAFSRIYELELAFKNYGLFITHQGINFILGKKNKHGFWSHNFNSNNN